MFATLKLNKISKKIASCVAGLFFVFTNLVVPANAVLYPGDPGAGMTPGAYGSYEYSFCYYNNNDDLECFDSVNPQLGIVKDITEDSKRKITTDDGGTTIPYKLTITNNSNPAQTFSTFYIKDYLPDAVESTTTPQVTGGTASSTGSVAGTIGEMTWTGTMEHGTTVEIEFDGVVYDDLSQYQEQYQDNVACVSDQPLEDGNQSANCNEVTFEITPPNPPQDEVDLLLNKSVVGENAFAPGDTVTYEFTVTNVGGATVSNFSINENRDVDERSVWPSDYVENITSVAPGEASLDTSTNTINWSGTLAPGASVKITAEAQVKSGIAENANVEATNRACVENDDDVNPANDCGTFKLVITPEIIDNPQLGIEKQIADDDQRSILVSEAGTTIPYQLTITNTTSPSRTINEFFVIDVLPPALVGTIDNVSAGGTGTAEKIGDTSDISWTGTLNFGQRVVITFDADLVGDLSQFEDTTQRNDACVRLTQDGRDEACHYDQFVIKPDQIPTELDLELFKGEKDGDTGFAEGETITYEFIVTNNSAVEVDTFIVQDLSLPNEYIKDISTDISLKAGDPGQVTIMGVDDDPNNSVDGIVWEGQGTTLGYGDTITIYAEVEVKTGLNLTETVSSPNTACVVAQNDVNQDNNCHDFSVNITPDNVPQDQGIVIQKEVVGPNVAYQGQTVEMDYRVTVGNSGDEAISPTEAEPVVITDTLPPIAQGDTIKDGSVTTAQGTATLQADGSTIHWYGSTIPAGGEIIIDYTVELDVDELANLDDGDVQINVATATYKDEEDDDDAEFTVEDPNQTDVDLHLEKTVDEDDVSSSVGQTINYTFTVTNTRSEDFTGEVKINEEQWPDEYLSDLTVVAPATQEGNVIIWSGTIPAGDSVDIQATAIAEQVGTATNIAVLDVPEDENPDNDRDDATTVITDVEPPEEGITIQKIIIGDAGLERGSDTTVEYEITVGNATDENITAFTIVEEQWPNVFESISDVQATKGTATLAANGIDIDWTGGESDFTPGDNIEVTFTGTLRTDLTEADDGMHQNVASVTYNGVTNKDDAEFTLTPPGGFNNDLGIQKEVDSEDIIVSPGENVDYTFTITNNSSTMFSGSFRIAEQWPSDYLEDIHSVNAEFGAVTLEGNDIIWAGDIAAGAQLKIFADAKAKDVEGQATNFATIKNPDGSDWEDDVPENDSDHTTTTIRDDGDNDPIDDVEKILNGNLQSVSPGQQVTFTATFTNNSQQTVAKVTLLENETNFTIDGISANEGDITGSSPTYTWTGELTPGETLTVTIEGTVADAVGEEMWNEITFDDPRDPNDEPIEDPDPEDNKDVTEPVPIVDDPLDDVKKTMDGNPSSVVPGQRISFTSTVTNRSGVAIKQATMTEYATGFRLESITPNKGTLSGNNPYTWEADGNDLLQPNETLTLTITGVVTGQPGEIVQNRISWSDPLDIDGNEIPDPDPSDNEAITPPVPIIGQPSVTPITGGLAAFAGVAGVAALAGAGYYFYRKRDGFKVNKR